MDTPAIYSSQKQFIPEKKTDKIKKYRNILSILPNNRYHTTIYRILFEQSENLMTITEYQLRDIISLGKDSTHQFKADIHNTDALASEMAAFANSEGGQILIGVGDDGSLPGLRFTDVTRINQLISNAASQHVHSPLSVQTENIRLDNGHIVILLTVPKGLDKPYFDRHGVI